MKASRGKTRLGAIVWLSIAAIAIVGVVARAQLATTAWPMFMHDVARTGLGTGNTSAITLPSEKWRSAYYIYYSSPVIGADGTIYVGGEDGQLHATNPDGTTKWTFQTGSVVRAAAAIGADGTIYIGSYDGNLYALTDGGQGNVMEKWAFNDGNAITSSPAIGTDGTIYIGDAGGKLRAITDNGASGTENWEFATTSQVNSSPAITADGSTVYVGSDDSNLYAVNTSDGSEKWAYLTGGAVEGSPAIGADGTIYVASDDTNLYALTDGGQGTVTQKWAIQTYSYYGSSPAIGADGTIYIGSYSSEGLYAINPDGSQKWLAFIGNVSYGNSPAISADGTIYIAAYGGIYAANPADGSQKWTYDLVGGAYIYGTAPAIGADGTIYVGTYTNPGLLAIGPTGPAPAVDQPAATTSHTTPASASVTLNFPSGVAANDICVAEFSYAATSLTVSAAPAGWTAIRSDNSGTTGRR